MNGYQRYMATLDGLPVDFPARTPNLMQFAADLRNQTPFLWT